jgi:hypothetical protein
VTAPADDGLDHRPGPAAQFESQAIACRENGSPLYADLCSAAADDLAAGGRLADILAPWARSRLGDMLPLRVLGAAHRLVLEREAPALALWFPSVGGEAPRDDAGRATCFRAWVDALDAHQDRLPDLLAGPPQTNDPGRSAVLLGALQHVAAAHSLPIRLHELGTSAGLLLLSDLVRVAWPGGAAGAPSSPVVLDDAWQGDPLPPPVPPVVVERVGCDRDPVDLTTTEGRLRLTSYVWPDQLDRFELLRGGLQLAAEHRVTVIRRDVVEHLESLELQDGTVLVLWHSSVWLYLDEQRRRAAAAIARLGAAATPERPLVHASRELAEDRVGRSFPLVVAGWPYGLGGEPAGAPVRLADSPPHGLPVTWHAPGRLDTE